MFAVVDDRNNTWIQHSFASLLTLQPSFLVIPSCSFVDGYKHTLHRFTHYKGGRRDDLEYGGDILPVAQRMAPHVNRTCAC
jgi:hypothetical protein